MRDYVKWLRERVGHDQIILTFAAACVVNLEGQILLQKRSETNGAWGFPGGVIEPGESAADAVVREVQEETGLTISVKELLGVYSKYFSDYPNGDRAQTIVVFFVCTVKGGTLGQHRPETDAVAFFNPMQAPRLFNQQHQDALTDLIQQRRGVYR